MDVKDPVVIEYFVKLLGQPVESARLTCPGSYGVTVLALPKRS